MPTCPRCEQLITQDAIQCPHCKVQLKAFGHPGIPLHQATGEDYLCATCLYDADDSCTYPQRPYAKTCTLYHHVDDPLEEEFQYQVSPTRQVRYWMSRNRGWLLILGLFLVCVLVAWLN
ncbi:zinc ribbon domain-containing protein [Spirulina sp. CS-785/01]|uniref:zinc ribbon domain-containing protein n=1 Tax=Spirulina sp. CS-785/01 TaxID=3021716 RepID=UPI00232F8C97|nr:zinc ribbon domain-containing protein [Spirulina sp. CS-785/01]MDB9313374.1 zinc ribbon domain-containing protein [Spirulina sp. CS-785/01]